MSVFVYNHDTELDLLKRVSENTGLPKEMLGHNPDVFMNYEKYSTYNIPNLEKAVKIFEAYANKKKPIYVYCDYDVDGMGAATIIDMLAKSLGIKVEIYVPDRFEDGYGLTSKFVLERPSGDALLLTFDNGISTHEAISLAKQKGWEVCVLDHHLAKYNEQGEVDLPEADVIVDPHITGGDCIDYCGAGLAYKFAQRCYDDTKLTVEKKEYYSNMMLVQAAVSTIADSVNLSTENYQIVEKGLQLLSEGKCSFGMRLLADKFNLLGKQITTTDLNFGLVAALNAWGRLEGDGSRNVVKCLTYNGAFSKEITDLRDEIVLHNEERKALTTEALDRANRILAETGRGEDNVIVIYDPECKHGLCGLVAGRLCNTNGAPCIYLTDTRDDNGNVTGIIAGSGRSCGEINLKEALDRSAHFLESYGGHSGACGVALYRAHLDDFIKFLNEITPAPIRTPEIGFEMLCALSDLPSLEKEFGKYMWGMGNPSPVLLFPDIEIAAVQTLGANGKTLKLTAYMDEEKKLPVSVMSFNDAPAYTEMGSPRRITVQGYPSDNVFRGKHSLQLVANLFEPAEDTVIKEPYDEIEK